MHKAYLLIFFILYFFVTYCQGNFVTTWQQMNTLNNNSRDMAMRKIKSVTQTRYLFASGKPMQDGRLAQKTSYDTSGKIMCILHYDNNGNAEKDSFIYNARGQIIKREYSKKITQPEQMSKSTGIRTDFYSRGYYSSNLYIALKDRGDGTGNKNTWQYDESGKKLGDITSPGNFLYNFEYKWDKNNYLSEELYAENDEAQNQIKFTWKINKQGLPAELTRYKPDNSSIRYVWKYDTLGRKIMETEYNADGNITSTTWKYNAKGEKTDQTVSYFDKSIFRIVWKYNDTGKISDEFYYQSDGRTPDGRTSFEYSSEGLLLKVLEKDVNNIDVFFTKFTYEFYTP